MNRELPKHAKPESSKTERDLTAAHFGAAAPGLTAVLERIATIRAVADARSQAYEKWLWWLNVAVFGLLFLSLVAFHTYAHLPTKSKQVIIDTATQQPVEVVTHHHHPPVLWVAIAALVTALLLPAWPAFFRWDHHRQDSRALAEALRVRFWWCMAGVGDSVALNYPRQLRTEVAWIRQAIRVLSMPVPEDWTTDYARRPDRRRVRLQAALKHLVAAQTKQHFTKTEKYRRSAARCRTGGLCAAGLGWLMLPLAVYDGVHPSHVLLFLAGVLTIFGGLLIGFGERRTYEELANQYNRAYGMFRSPQHEMTHLLAEDHADPKFAGTPYADPEWRLHRAQNIVRTLGLEHLHENGHWLLVRRTKPLETPVA